MFSFLHGGQQLLFGPALVKLIGNLGVEGWLKQRAKWNKAQLDTSRQRNGGLPQNTLPAWNLLGGQWFDADSEGLDT